MELFATIGGKFESVHVRSLTGADATPGTHKLQWDGALPTSSRFPDGFATIEFSPYRLELSVAGGEPAIQKATFEVKVAEMKIELADKRCVVGSGLQSDDLAIHKQVGSLPTAGLRKLYLRSDLYATKSEEMTSNDAFTAFRTLWGLGPRIPVIATVTVKSVAGAAVKAPKALGKSCVLWDYSSPAMTHPAYGRPTVTAFVDRALAYDAAQGRPANTVLAHGDRGGKRYRGGSGTSVFAAPDAGIQAFPFTVDPAGIRRWCAFSPILKSGPHEAQAGVVFRPARTSGDRYVVTAWLSRDRELDKDVVTPTGALAEAKVGEFQMWRRITLVKHIRKCPQITGALPDISGYSAEAFIDVENRIPRVKTLDKDEYDSRFAAARDAVDPAEVSVFLRECALPANVSQYDNTAPSVIAGAVRRVTDLFRSLFGGTPAPAPTPTTWIANFETYAAFRARVKSKYGFTTTVLQNRLDAASVGNEADYFAATLDYAIAIATKMCALAITQNGITVLQFDRVHSFEPAMSGRINGNAVFHTRERTGFALYNPRQDTTGHEIGHCMFLPHAPRLDPDDGSLIDSGGGITPARHDVHELNCLMSYARPRQGFCGLCNLRLRGWDATQFDQNGPMVNKP